MPAAAAKRIEERKFLKKWIGKTVYAKSNSGNPDGVFWFVTAVDVIRGKIRIGDTWEEPCKLEILKSKKKKHWKRRTQFVLN